MDKSILRWKYRSSYVIVLLSWSTGLTNVFHSPKLLLEIGIFNYLLVHVVVMVIVGIPMTLTELAVSQYSLKSVVRCWDVCPFFRGVGYGKFILIAIFHVYYNSLNSYLLSYCFAPLPSEASRVVNGSNIEAFWYNEIIQNKGFPNWKLVASLTAHTILEFIINFNGTKLLENILPLLYYLSIFELIVLLCVIGASPGGMEGVKCLYTKQIDFNYLLIWKKEGILLQVFQMYLYSIGLALGGFSDIAAQGSFRNPLYKISVWVNLANLGTTLVYGNLFSMLNGIVQPNTTKCKSEIGPEKDFSFIFTKIPNALNGGIWKYIFYSSLYLKGVCTSSLMLKTILDVIYEEKPELLSYSRLCCIVFSICNFLLGSLIFTNLGFIIGQFIVDVIIQIFLPLIVTIQAVTIVFIYGLFRFTTDLYFMLGVYPTIYWPLCLTLSVIALPILSTVSIINYFKTTNLTDFNLTLFKGIVSVTLAWIPFMAMVRVIRKVKFDLIFRSSPNWNPPDGLETSRKQFEEQHCVEEFLYERYLLQRKLKRYE
ncbi:unnamed protein product [Phyllotreta striolata]|uniref:Uncharacterized protein n=1 Tax=Phyllotreta striolata TaxID=444603 RepID=A0A9N9U1X7_PHYSR|nr:unnamed protein product [Phyllotreta striolata]